jgi:hypothetical protein
VRSYRNGSNLIKSEEDLSLLMEIMKEEVFQHSIFVDYFLFNIKKVTEDYVSALKSKGIKIIEKESEVEDDENIFSRSGFDIIVSFILENITSVGK